MQSAEDIAALAAAVADRNFRIATAADGIHVYSAGLHETGQDSFGFFPKLGVADDGAHAFYLGTELMKAQIATTLGKRYVQDEPLDWGCAAPRKPRDVKRLAEAGHTLRPKRGDADDP
jgi:hypothetical protein